ncbi:hypothetical protein ACOTD2_23410, partial [Achromobacter xylosoxidans]
MKDIVFFPTGFEWDDWILSLRNPWEKYLVGMRICVVGCWFGLLCRFGNMTLLLGVLVFWGMGGFEFLR